MPTECTVLAAPERLRRFRASVCANAQPSDVAPPTFMTVCREGEMKLLAELKIPLTSVLHAEQEYEYEEPIRAGDELVFEARLAKENEKRGSTGTLRFLTFETRVRVRRGGAELPAGLSRTLIVVKGAA